MARSTSIVSKHAKQDRDAGTRTNKRTTGSAKMMWKSKGKDRKKTKEYEIEAILTHQHNMFAGERTGYLCEWKGYSSNHNSWVDENDAENAKELIERYWEKVHPKKTPRKSAAPTEKGRPSYDNANANADTDSPKPAPKKHSRNSAAEIDADDEEGEKNTTLKGSGMQTRSRNTTTHWTEQEDMVMDKPEEQIADHKYMKKFMSRETWENIVDTVDTVEKSNTDEGLLVIFRLNAANGGTCVCLESSICREKFPQALLTFYESCLGWKETEVDDDMPLA